jgi:hypothetical protein
MRQINHWPAPKREERKDDKIATRAICVSLTGLFASGARPSSVPVSGHAKAAVPSGVGGHGPHPDTATLVGRALPRRPNFSLQGWRCFPLAHRSGYGRERSGQSGSSALPLLVAVSRCARGHVRSRKSLISKIVLDILTHFLDAVGASGSGGGHSALQVSGHVMGAAKREDGTRARSPKSQPKPERCS